MTDLRDLRLLSYGTLEEPRGGVLAHDRVYDLEMLLRHVGLAGSSVLDLLEQWHPARSGLPKAVDHLDGEAVPLSEVRLLPPVLYPRGMFFAGANYTDHVAEMAAVLGLPDDGPRREGDLPWHFVGLPAHNLVGSRAPFSLPAYSSKVDWEAEIGVVIGRNARHVAVEEAMDYVAGLTIVNDVSARDWVARPSVPVGSPFRWDWVSQKCFEGSCPMGPWITPLEAVRDPGDLGIRLWVNDELMQDSSSRNLIFSMAEQIAHLSTRVTLRPGDVISTGTPAGVGMARGRFLRPGDDVRIVVDGLGELRNHAIG